MTEYLTVMMAATSRDVQFWPPTSAMQSLSSSARRVVSVYPRVGTVMVRLIVRTRVMSLILVVLSPVQQIISSVTMTSVSSIRMFVMVRMIVVMVVMRTKTSMPALQSRYPVERAHGDVPTPMPLTSASPWTVSVMDRQTVLMVQTRDQTVILTTVEAPSQAVPTGVCRLLKELCAPVLLESLSLLTTPAPV